VRGVRGDHALFLSASTAFGLSSLGIGTDNMPGNRVDIAKTVLRSTENGGTMHKDCPQLLRELAGS
jgi:hypothetical protein